MPTAPAPPAEDRIYLRAALSLTAALTLIRLIVLFASPLELYPDEAQYWLWSRTLAWGYFSKPPLIAWAIWATTQIGGDAEGWVRASAALFHAGATLAAFAIGRRLYGPASGLAGAALYALMPGVQLSALVIATDAPLLLFLGLAIWAYVEHLERPRWTWALVAGVALGLAFLSKYAAVFGLIGLGLHLALSGPARRCWTWRSALAALVGLALTLAPNLAWNAAHGFATFQHTAANAGWRGRLFDPAQLGEFLATQFGVFGPIPLAVLLGGTALAALRRRLSAADLTLLCFSLPPLAIVAVQAFVSRANANWSGAGYLTGAVLVAAWLLRWRAKWWLTAALATQAAAAALFLAWVVSPRLADSMGVANSFKRAKGWRSTVEALVARTREEQAGRGLTAVAVDDRFLFNAAAYYGRETFGKPGAPPLTMWVREARPHNQAETEAPLTPALGGRVLAASLERVYRDEMAADFARTADRQIVRVSLDAKRRRTTELFVAEDFAPLPRDPKTGLPPRQP